MGLENISDINSANRPAIFLEDINVWDLHVWLLVNFLSILQVLTDGELLLVDYNEVITVEFHGLGLEFQLKGGFFRHPEVTNFRSRLQVKSLVFFQIWLIDVTFDQVYTELLPFFHCEQIYSLWAMEQIAF